MQEDCSVKKFVQQSIEFCPMIKHWKVPEKEPIYSEGFPEGLNEKVKEIFRDIRLYKHQYEFIDNAIKGRDCFIISGTGGGKTISFLLPTLHRIFSNREKGLIIYPTKALAYDQYLGFKKLPIKVGVLDGDSDNKRAVLKSDLIITNPQALGVYISTGLLNEKIIKSFGVIVIDEFHFLKGIEAGNFALTLRDFLFKNDDKAQILLASATVGNPEELAKSYFPHREFVIVKGDYGKSFEKDFLIFNDDVRYNKFEKPTVSVLKTLPDWLKDWYVKIKPRIKEIGALNFATPIIAELAYYNIPTIVFCRKKIDCERLLGKVQKYAKEKYGISPQKFSTYYSDFPKEERREIEKKFREGEIICLISTSALEVGIDLTVSCVVCIDSCDTVNSFKQQVGRAGRKGYGFILYIPQEMNLLLDYLLKRHPNDLPLEKVKILITKESLREHILSLFNQRVFMSDEKWDVFKKLYGVEGINIFTELRYEGILKNNGRVVYHNLRDKVVPLIFEGGVVDVVDKDGNLICKLNSTDVWKYPVNTTIIKNQKYYRVIETYKKGHEYILVEPINSDAEIFSVGDDVRLEVKYADEYGFEYLVRKIPLSMRSQYRVRKVKEDEVAEYWELNYGIIVETVLEHYDEKLIDEILEYINMVYGVRGFKYEDEILGLILLFPVKIGYIEFKEILEDVLRRR